MGEELGWRGFLLPQLLEKYPPLTASVVVGLVWAAWHIPLYYRSFFGTLSGGALFVASTVAVSILMTVLFVHTRASVLLAVMMHWSIVPWSYIVRISFPAAQEPPDWLRAVVVITLAVIIAVLTGKGLGARCPSTIALQ